MIMAGGTGGHVFPGLAVAEALRARHGSVVWLGTQRGLEARVVPQQGIDIEWISIAGVRGRGVTAWLGAPFRIARRRAAGLAALRRRRPAAVFGMGGFVAGPGGVAAWLARKPLVHPRAERGGRHDEPVAGAARGADLQVVPGHVPAVASASRSIGNAGAPLVQRDRRRRTSGSARAARSGAVS